MKKFQKEQRYIVLKLKDVEKLPSLPKQYLGEVCRMVAAQREADGKAPLECVVVEHDWSIYKLVWALVKVVWLIKGVK